MAVPKEPVLVHSLEEVGKRGNKEESCHSSPRKGLGPE